MNSVNHTMFGADDFEVSRGFYEAALGALVVRPGVLVIRNTFFLPAAIFAITEPIDGAEAAHKSPVAIGVGMVEPLGRVGQGAVKVSQALKLTVLIE